MINSISILFSSNMTVMGLSFLRNLIIARIIDLENYGIAASFAIAVSAIEAMTMFGLDRHMVQSQKGDDTTFQASLQTVQITRGVTGSILLYFLVEPYAKYLGNYEHLASYRYLCLVPLIRGFLHFDIYRLERNHKFGKGALVNIGASVASLATGITLVYILTDYRVMIAAILMQHASLVALSHIIADRTYQVGFKKEFVEETYRFGSPLWVNSVLIFFIHNGEAVAIGGTIGMETLAGYYNVLLITLNTALVADMVMRTVSLPWLTEVRESITIFGQRFKTTQYWNLIVSASIAVVLWTIGPHIVVILFGGEYQTSTYLVVPLATLASIKVLKVSYNTAALALGHSKNLMYASLPRAALIFLEVVLLSSGCSLATILQIAILGEVLGLMVAVEQLKRAQHAAANHIMPKSTYALMSVLALFSTINYIKNDTHMAWYTGKLEAASIISLVILIGLTVTLVRRERRS